jgi:DNA-binding NarL/FixJ family response regulator
VREALRDLDLDVRAGLHTGECELIDGKVGGIAVHIGARVAAQAGPGEVLVSQTVRDLVAGSGLELEEVRGHAAGLPGGVGLLRVRAPGLPPQPTPVEDAHRPAAAMTAREREIAGLVALGLTNRQIADELVISSATVDRHVANILVKLGAHSRAQIAAWAVTEGEGRRRGGVRG